MFKYMSGGGGHICPPPSHLGRKKRASHNRVNSISSDLGYNLIFYCAFSANSAYSANSAFSANCVYSANCAYSINSAFSAISAYSAEDAFSAYISLFY